MNLKNLKESITTQPLLGPHIFALRKRIRKEIPAYWPKFLNWQGAKKMAPATAYFFNFRVQNWGRQTWKAPRGRDDGIFLGYRWKAKDKDIVEYEHQLTPLPRDLRPGEVVTFRSVVRAPFSEGNFTLIWDFRDKEKGWFIDQEHLSEVTLNLPFEVKHAAGGRLDEPRIALWTTLNITSRCNLKCFHCSRTVALEHGRKESAGEMNSNIVERVTREILPRTWQLSLTGIGEPLMSRWSIELLERATKIGVPQIDLTTNGTLLNQKLLERILSTGITRIIVSADAASRQTYEKIRQGASLERFLKNMRLLGEIRECLNPRVVLRFNMVIHRENIKELPRYLSMAKTLGVQEVALFHLIVHDLRFFPLSLYNSQEEANRSLDEAREIARDLGIVLFPPENFPQDKSRPQGKKDGAPYRQSCFQPWKELLIGQDGTISPCCSWRDDLHGSLGDGFENAWNGSLLRNLREELNSGKLRQGCRNCLVLTGGPVQRKENFISRLAEDLEKGN